MKKFFAFLLAVVLISFSVTVSFAAPTGVNFSLSFYDDLSKIYSRFEQASGDYLIPYYFSNNSYLSTFSNILGSNNYYFLFRFYPKSPSSLGLYCIPKNIPLTFGEKSGSYSGQKLYTLSSTSSFYLISFSFNSDTGFFNNSNFNSQCKTVSLYDSVSNSIYFDSSGLFSKYSSSIPSSVLYFKDISNISLIDSSEYQPPVIGHTLTVNYLYADDNPAADPVTQTIAAGEAYSIPSPEVAGYAPSIPVVSGTMPDEDLTVNVYYSKAFYDLKVKYQHLDGTEAASEVAFQYPAGFVYDIPSPAVAGYQPDKLSVYGEMPAEAVTETVTYSPIPYTLTVNYQYADGTKAAEPYLQQLHKGDSYSVPSPEITGYHPNQSAVTGVMPAEDVTATVTYREDSGGSGGTGGAGSGEGGGSGGEGEDPGGGSGSGDDPFIPVLPPSSGYDPFVVPGVPPYSGDNPFIVGAPPPFSGYDPFVIRQPPPWSGYDPFAIPDYEGG